MRDEVMVIVLASMFVLMFWNFDGPGGEDYKYDLYDLHYMEMINEVDQTDKKGF